MGRTLAATAVFCALIWLGPEALACTSNSTTICVKDYGARGDGTTDDTAAVQNALNASGNLGNGLAVKVVFEAGTYRLVCSSGSNAPCLILTPQFYNPQSVTITGAGSDPANNGTLLRFENPDTGGLQVFQAPNVKISNLAIDYSTPPYVQGTVTAVTTSYLEFQADSVAMTAIPAALCSAYAPIPSGNDASPPHGYYAGTSFGLLMESSNGKLVKRNALPGGTILPQSCQDQGGGKWRIGLASGISTYVNVGDKYVQLVGRNYTKSTIWFDSSSNAEVNNVVIRAGGGLATLFTGNTGTILVHGLQVRFAPGSARYLTTDADGVHLQHNWATPTIENSYFEGMADDGVNVYAKGDQVTAFTAGVPEVLYSAAVQVGDWVEVLDPVTGALRGAGSVTAVTNGIDSYHKKLTISPAPTGVQVGDLTFDTSASGMNAQIRNNTFGRHRGRGVVDQSFGSTISGNLFSDVNWYAIQLIADSTYSEGPTAHNVTIQGNQMMGGDLSVDGQISADGMAAPGSIPAYGPSNITVASNRLINAKAANIYVRSTYNASITNNQIYGPSCPRSTNAGIDTLYSTAVTLTGTLQSCAQPTVTLASFDPTIEHSAGGDYYYGPTTDGSLDVIDSSGNASGWAVDMSNSSESVWINYYLDGPYGTGTLLNYTYANLASPDLVAIGIPGAHRFSSHVDLPTNTHGWHTLFVYGNRVGQSAFLFTPNGVSFYVP